MAFLCATASLRESGEDRSESELLMHKLDTAGLGAAIGGDQSQDTTARPWQRRESSYGSAATQEVSG